MYLNFVILYIWVPKSIVGSLLNSLLLIFISNYDFFFSFVNDYECRVNQNLLGHGDVDELGSFTEVFVIQLEILVI